MEMFLLALSVRFTALFDAPRIMGALTVILPSVGRDPEPVEIVTLVPASNKEVIAVF